MTIDNTIVIENGIRSGHANNAVITKHFGYDQLEEYNDGTDIFEIKSINFHRTAAYNMMINYERSLKKSQISHSQFIISAVNSLYNLLISLKIIIEPSNKDITKFIRNISRNSNLKQLSLYSIHNHTLEDDSILDISFKNKDFKDFQPLGNPTNLDLPIRTYDRIKVIRSYLGSKNMTVAISNIVCAYVIILDLKGKGLTPCPGTELT